MHFGLDGAFMSPGTSTAKHLKSLWTLGGLPPSQLFHNVLGRIVENDVFGRAAELAFYFLFSLPPLILVIMTLLGWFSSRSIELHNNLLSYFAAILPSEAFQLLGRVADELAAHASRGKLTFGIVSALWFVSGGVSAMIDALNLAYGVRETRSWLKVRATALGLSLLISILILTALFLVLASSHLVDWLGRGLRLHPIVVLVWKAIQLPAAILLVAISCSLVYFFGPDLKGRHYLSWLTPGSAFGVLVWLAASFVFRIYLHFFNDYSASYGSLGAVMILLAWLYVAGLAYLIGGEINGEIERAGNRCARVTSIE
jgi:membrane protein